jgi:dCTP deaminase
MSVAIWPSQAIRRAVEAGMIAASVPVLASQIQPASLDLRLGDRAWRVPASFLPGSGVAMRERLAELATHEIDLARPTVLERDCVHIIPLIEGLRLPSGVAARANPKSTSGRLDIFVRVIVDGGTAFDVIPEGYQGALYAEVVPRSFPVIAGAGTCLAQLRLREASLDKSEARIVPVTIDLNPADKEDGIIGWRARRTSGLIDLARIGAYPRLDFWEPVKPPPNRRGLVLDPDDFYILASLETVTVDVGEAAEMVAYDTSVGEVRVHYAGFLDPGFGLDAAGGAGSRVVLEVRSHDVPYLLDHGQRVATLRYERLREPPDIVYGRDIQSNYQGQRLKLSKHFI